MVVLLYTLLGSAVLYCLLRTLARPTYALCPFLTLFGLKQVALAASPQLAACPWLLNVGVTSLTVFALVLSFCRKEGETEWLPVWKILGVYVCFYAFYFTVALCTDASDDFWKLATANGPYIPVRVFVVPMLLWGRSHREVSEVFTATSLLCLLILTICYVDDTLRADETVVGSRFVLRSLRDEIHIANPLALADIGAILILLTMCGGHIFGHRSIGPLGVVCNHLVRVAVVVSTFLFTIQVSRGEPFAAIGAGLVALCATRSRRTQLLWILLPLGLLVVGLRGSWLFQTLVEFAPRLESLDDGTDIRGQLIGFAWHNYHSGGVSTLLLGLGPGYTLTHFGMYPHNVVVESLTETGPLGLALLCVWPLRASMNAYRRLPGECGPLAKVNIAFCLAMVVYQSLVALKRGSVLQPDLFMWTILLEIVMSLKSDATKGLKIREAVCRTHKMASPGMTRRACSESPEKRSIHWNGNTAVQAGR